MTAFPVLGHSASPTWLALTILAVVALIRIAELAVSQRNRKRLLATGGHEVGASHYPLLVALHASWLAALAIWIIVLPVRIHPAFLVVYGALQPLRLWVITSLGHYWTTRIITVPGAPLVRHGPYRFMRHPNYVVVVLEIAALPLVFGAWPLALAFSVLNAAVLAVRITTENAALTERRASR